MFLTEKLSRKVLLFIESIREAFFSQVYQLCSAFWMGTITLHTSTTTTTVPDVTEIHDPSYMIIDIKMSLLN